MPAVQGVLTAPGPPPAPSARTGPAEVTLTGELRTDSYLDPRLETLLRAILIELRALRTNYCNATQQPVLDPDAVVDFRS